MVNSKLSEFGSEVLQNQSE